MSSVPRPGQVPTLTEVVEFEATEPVPLGTVVSERQLAEGEAPPLGTVDLALPEANDLDTKTLVERVLADVQRQFDPSIDYRLREALTPVLVRLADAMVREARAQLSTTLREIVTKAVSQEIARQRRR